MKIYITFQDFQSKLLIIGVGLHVLEMNRTVKSGHCVVLGRGVEKIVVIFHCCHSETSDCTFF